MPQCNFCKKYLKSTRGVNRHVNSSSLCRKRWEEWLARHTERICGIGHNENAEAHHNVPQESENDFDGPITASHEPNAEQHAASLTATSALPPPRNRVTIEEMEDEEAGPLRPGARFVQPFPGPAGKSSQTAKTSFEEIREGQEARGEGPWGPFKDEPEWELARWLVRNVGQAQMETFLDLPIVRACRR